MEAKVSPAGQAFISLCMASFWGGLLAMLRRVFPCIPAEAPILLFVILFTAGSLALLLFTSAARRDKWPPSP